MLLARWLASVYVGCALQPSATPGSVVDLPHQRVVFHYIGEHEPARA